MIDRVRMEVVRLANLVGSVGNSLDRGRILVARVGISDGPRGNSERRAPIWIVTPPVNDYEPGVWFRAVPISPGICRCSTEVDRNRLRYIPVGTRRGESPKVQRAKLKKSTILNVPIPSWLLCSVTVVLGARCFFWALSR